MSHVDLERLKIFKNQINNTLKMKKKKVKYKSLNSIFDLVYEKVKPYNIKSSDGKFLFSKKIINIIINLLDDHDINHKMLSQYEIDNIVNCKKISQSRNYLQVHQKNIQKESLISKLIPRKDQILIIEKSLDHFQQFDKGMLILMCGVGKTLISLWIASKMEAKSILIGVPNILLLEQWAKSIQQIFAISQFSVMSVCSGITQKEISDFIVKRQQNFIILSTYASCHKVLSASKKINFTFQMKINDEVHHLTSQNTNTLKDAKIYVKMLEIKAEKHLSLTATQRLFKEINQFDEYSPINKVISNDNKQHFGEVIWKKCLAEAIKENIICDYAIQVLFTDYDDLNKQLEKFNITEEIKQRLFLSAFSALKTLQMDQSHHVLVYSNNLGNSVQIIKYIKLLLNQGYFNLKELFYHQYNSNIKSDQQGKILADFNIAKKGIIACVYCLGEGYDNNIIDAVIFSENMSSDIRIVQSALRAGRKNNKEPNKLAKFILPIIDKDDFNGPDLKKVKEVINQIGLEDEFISQKIKVYKLNLYDQSPENTKTKQDNNDQIGDYDSEITQKIRLRTTRRATQTYEKAKRILAPYKVTSKQHYLLVCEKELSLPIDPENEYCSQFTSWVDYLSIQMTCYNYKDCISRIDHLLDKNPNMRFSSLNLRDLCEKIHQADSKFPHPDFWLDYYKVNDLNKFFVKKVNQSKTQGFI